MKYWNHILKNPGSSSSLSPPEHQSAPLYGNRRSPTHNLFALLPISLERQKSKITMMSMKQSYDFYCWEAHYY